MSTLKCKAYSKHTFSLCIYVKTVGLLMKLVFVAWFEIDPTVLIVQCLLPFGFIKCVGAGFGNL